MKLKDLLGLLEGFPEDSEVTIDGARPVIFTYNLELDRINIASAGRVSKLPHDYIQEEIPYVPFTEDIENYT